MNTAQLQRWLPFLSRPLTKLRAASRGPLAAAQALRSRDRIALGAALVALCAALDLTVVSSLNAKRRAIEQALQSSTQDLDAARSGALAQRQARETELEKREAKALAALAGLGAAGAQRESLRFLLSRTLQGLPVSVVALRSLGAEELDLGSAVETPPVPPSATAAEATPAPAAGASTAAGSAPTLLYQHRYELQLSGALQSLLAALDTLEKGTRPLRVERFRLAADATGVLQAHVVLMTLAPQRQWLTL